MIMKDLSGREHADVDICQIYRMFEIVSTSVLSISLQTERKFSKSRISDSTKENAGTSIKTAFLERFRTRSPKNHYKKFRRIVHLRNM